VELGIGDAVTFLGHIEYDEMPKVYRSADVLVLPSRAEGLPRTVLEAFASEVSVVASDLEQVAPIVEEAGETVSVGDVDGFERELGRLVDNVDRRRAFGRNGRQIVNERFRWEETVAETTHAVKQL
jgi:glycosyltransferase involved in cell wall biosynthesis